MVGKAEKGGRDKGKRAKPQTNISLAGTGPLKSRESEGSGSDGAASLLNLLAGGGAQALDLDSELAAKLTIAKDLDGIADAVDEVFLTERSLVHHGAIFEDVKLADIDGFVHVTELFVGEAFLGKAAEEWHLATFETWADAATGAGHLTFVPFTGSLAVAGAFATADALTAFDSAWTRLGIV